MKPIIILMALALGGCDKIRPTMTNDEIISECKKCEDAGMKPELARYLEGGAIARVDCVPVVKP